MPEVAEQLFARPQHTRDFGDGAPDRVGVHPARHPADMRQLRQAGQRAAAEVQAVELDLLGGVGGGGRHDQRAQRRRLARLWAADHRHVALRAGQIDHQHDRGAGRRADRPRPSASASRPLMFCGAVQSVSGSRFVDGGAFVQRRQPHLVRRSSVAAQSADHHVEQRGLRRRRRRSSVPLRRASGSTGRGRTGAGSFFTGVAVNSLGASAPSCVTRPDLTDARGLTYSPET